MKRTEIRACIENIGIVPALRASSPADGLFAAKMIRRGGIPIVEVTMTVPGALDVLSALADSGDFIVGAGAVMDLESARCCIDAGASFLTSAGLDPDVVDLAIRSDIAVFPGILTPTEAIAAWKPRPDFLKVYPCSQIGGAGYIRVLKGPFPQIPLIAAGGVTQRNAADFIAAGASAISLGGELLPAEAIRLHDENRILELARRFLSIVKQARKANSPEIARGGSRPSFSPRESAATSLVGSAHPS